MDKRTAATRTLIALSGEDWPMTQADYAAQNRARLIDFFHGGEKGKGNTGSGSSGGTVSGGAVQTGEPIYAVVLLIALSAIVILAFFRRRKFESR